MSSTRMNQEQDVPAARRADSSESTRRALTAGQLPKYIDIAAFVVSVVVVAGILGLAGKFSFGLSLALGFIVFVIGLRILSMSVEGSRRAADRTARHMVTGAFALAILPLISVLWTVISKGLARFDVEFFTYSMFAVVGEGGGAVHAIWGTLIITGICTLIAVPVGIFTSIFLVEYSTATPTMRKLANLLRFFVDVMTGIPSIVAGLFAYTLFAIILGPGTKSGLAGAIALAVLMIPVVVRSTEEMLRLVPNELREASYALGVPKWKTIVKVVLPTSIAGIVTGVILAIARVIGETAPLLVTAGIYTGLNTNALEGQMATLPVFSYYQYVTPGTPPEPYIARAFTSALTLIIIVMALNAVGRFVAAKFAPKTGR